MSYARHGANSSMAAWTHHRKEVFVDSVMSDFSGMHLGRPGLGDKMFNNAADLGPLTSISASPPENSTRPKSAIIRLLILLLTTTRGLRKTHYLGKLTIVLPCHLTQSLVMIIISKMVFFLPINSGLFLFTVSAAFIVQ